MTDDSSPDDGSLTSRRNVLRLLASSAGSSLAGCGGWGPSPEPTETPAETQTEESPTPAEETPTETGVPHAEQFGTVVNMVEDAGADQTGEESIVPLLDEYADDDTLLFFPEGEYLMDGIWEYPQFTNIGIVGNGATIVPREGYTGYLFILGLRGRSARDLLFEGFEFDFRADGTTPRPLQVAAEDGVVVRDVLARGTSGTVRIDVTSADGKGLVERLRLPDGGVDNPNPVGCLVGPPNKGALTFRDCEISGFPGNGLYASPSEGPITVEGGEYNNNGIACVRVSSPAEVRGVSVRCDAEESNFPNMRGIRLRHGKDVLVEDCTVEMISVPSSGGGIVVGTLLETATIRNTEIRSSADGIPAINIKTPRESDGETAIDCENVSITGDASGGSTVRIVDRNGCALRNVDIEQTGENRDGIHLIRSNPSTMENIDVDVTGQEIVRKAPGE